MNHMCNCSGRRCGNHGLGMFLLRVVTGVILAVAGWEKIQNMAATQAGFASMHFPAWSAVLTGWAEFIGGIALVLGLFTCLTASVLAIFMAVAVVVSWNHGGFKDAEMALLTLASLLALKHGGRGKWGLGKHCGCLMCSWGKKNANICMNCGHAPEMKNGCDCDCHA